MCKLLIHIAPAPKHPTDDRINAGQYQPGDVVTIIEDDERFGIFDTGLHTAVVALPGVKKIDVEHLMSQDVTITKRLGPKMTVIEDANLNRLRMWNVKDVDAFKALSEKATIPKGRETAFTEVYFSKGGDIAAQPSRNGAQKSAAAAKALADLPAEFKYDATA
jgi:hypothetical protein